ncbi:LTA synthase family protein [Paenibacillus ginsengihumi]|uniref:LTA synthase family protein n=1 Tax=Paenibacillus ginsengihumi TaxID=431596 RepID=UPI000364390F|nr:LTA synthase family protein [Paenibacillus ginsengihumi]
MHMPQWFRWAVAAAVCCLIVIIRSSAGDSVLPPEKPPVIDEPSPIDWTPEQLARSPNIIVVLSESFWDPTRMDKLQFSRDPIPFFRSLTKKYPHGTMLSPMFGGGTANVELEVLTGLSMRFFPEGAIPYNTEINQPTESLASILAGQGYDTTAISAFHHWFSRSSEVNRHLGFGRFISLEFFNPDEYVGPYIGDHAVAKRIIEESARTDKPDFIFASTMENHYHFWPGKFERNTIKVQGEMSEAAIGIAETLAQGLSGADRMLQELVAHYRQTKEPTVIVFFGDHLPYLEENYKVYRESGYLSGEDDPDFLDKMHRVPFVVWSNYELPNTPQPAERELYMSPSFLGPYVLHLAGMPSSNFSDYLLALYNTTPVIPPPAYYESMGIDASLVQEYSRRQSERLAAERAAAGAGPSGSSGGPYVLGYGKPRIERAFKERASAGAPGDEQASRKVTVKGGRFGLGSVIVCNGEPLSTEWVAEDTLTAALPRAASGDTASLELKVRVVDSENRTLHESEPYALQAVPYSPRSSNE